jgi:hypothetical protein
VDLYGIILSEYLNLLHPEREMLLSKEGTVAPSKFYLCANDSIADGILTIDISSQRRKAAKKNLCVLAPFRENQQADE